MSPRKLKKELLTCSMIVAVLMLLGPSTSASLGRAQEGPAYIRCVRTLGTGELGIVAPAGLAFSPQANAFYVIEARSPAQPLPSDTEIVKVTPFGHQVGLARIPASIREPINVTFDSYASRLLILQPAARTLISVLENPDGNLDPATLVRFDARSFGLQNPQGMTVDPDSGHLFILDATGPRIVRIEPNPNGSFDNAAISDIDLGCASLVEVRGLALDPAKDHFYVLSPTEQVLHELTDRGKVVTTRDLSGFDIAEPQAFVYAPSGDATDDPADMSLYVADSGPLAGINQRANSTPNDQDMSAGPGAQARPGNIAELSLTVVPAAPAADYVATLVRTVDTSTYDPPSPDPSGLTYLPSHNTLLMTDGEVEETVDGITHFQGVNVWETTLNGDVVYTTNISRVEPTLEPMTNEPSGVAWNDTNMHLYVVDDVLDRVYDLDVGPDGLVGTEDDTRSSFDTDTAGSADAEGITFDTWQSHLFVVDGVNMEVYEFTLAGDLVSHFDVEQYGIEDPETVEFNPYSGTLFILSSKRTVPVVIETTPDGTLLQTIDISAADPEKAAGLAYAPASNGSGAVRFYIVDRGIDNNTDPNIVDGKMYEVTAPSSSAPGSEPPVAMDDAYNTGENGELIVAAPGILDNDSDPQGDALAAILVSDVSQGSLALDIDGSFIYTPSVGFVGTDSFVYEATSEDAVSGVATVSITVWESIYLPLVLRLP